MRFELSKVLVSICLLGSLPIYLLAADDPNPDPYNPDRKCCVPMELRPAQPGGACNCSGGECVPSDAAEGNDSISEQVYGGCQDTTEVGLCVTDNDLGDEVEIATGFYECVSTINPCESDSHCEFSEWAPYTPAQTHLEMLLLCQNTPAHICPD